MLKLIADSGSTKTEWCWLQDGMMVQTLTTSGINPIHQTNEQINEMLMCELPGKQADELYFYGAGCAFDDRNAQLSKLLQRYFGALHVEVASDMLGAARALCGRESGVACILGTGSNTCWYNGSEIEQNIRPLGYILGDEGSGAVLGKRLISNILKGIASLTLQTVFSKEYPYSYAELMDRIYRQPLANRFLASFVPFLSKHIDMPEVVALVEVEFGLFVERNVLQYKEARQLPIAFTGSVAWYFRSVLANVLLHYGLQNGKVMQAPMEGLIKYHK